MIDTREELIDALTEAAELEHTLLIQYLFAAFSVKRNLDEGITPIQQSRIIAWERTILEVAREEMGHLGLVCNLLSSIGAAPRFGRPNFPKSATKYYPLIADFTLTRFSIDTMYRFVCFELPVDVEPPQLKSFLEKSMLSAKFRVPDPLVYNRVGDLYAQISKAFEVIDSNKLFIGPKTAQDDDEWSIDLNLQLVKDKASAQKAIRDIVLDGEGTTSDRKDSHYLKFLSIWEELQALDFEPARNVVDNPFTRKHRDSDEGEPVNIIQNSDTKKVSELFSSLYNTMLLMLLQYYSYNGESKEQRLFLKQTLGQMMSGLIRPLAEILTQMPMTDKADDGFAGPSFEIYSDLRLSPFIDNRWTILTERFSDAFEEAAALKKVHPRFNVITQNLEWILNNLNKLTKKEN